jgi:hypothetical protein
MGIEKYLQNVAMVTECARLVEFCSNTSRDLIRQSDHDNILGKLLVVTRVSSIEIRSQYPIMNFSTNPIKAPWPHRRKTVMHEVTGLVALATNWFFFLVLLDQFLGTGWIPVISHLMRQLNRSTHTI